MVLSPDGRYLIVTNNGYAKPTLRVVDLERGVVAQTVALDDAWLGLAWHPDGTKLYSSGAAANSVIELAWRNGRLTRTGTLPLGRSARETHRGQPLVRTCRRVSWAASRSARTARGSSRCTCSGKRSRSSSSRRASCAPPRMSRPSRTRRSSPRTERRCSSRSGAARASCCSIAETLAPKGEIVVGEHPNAMVQAGGRRGCSSPARTRTPSGSSISPRRRPPSRFRSRSFPKRRLDRRRTRSRSRPTANGCSSPTPTTTRSRSWTSRSPAPAA